MKYPSITAFHKSILNGEASFTETVNYYLSQIDVNKGLNAFVNVFAEDALARAAALDQQKLAGMPMGKLAGVVISIKDNICYKGHIATAGSKILEGYHSPFSATAVEKLVNEGAIIIGTTNCDQFGMGSMSTNSHYGPVRNGADPELIAGGSSGGAAVSVQMDMCMAALGSDTGGSIRQPAAFTDTIGFKPSYGAVSRYGLIAYGSSFDQIGTISNNYEDARTIFEIMAGSDEKDSTSIDIEKDAKTYAGRPKLAYVEEMFEGDQEWMQENRAFLESLRETCDLVKVDFHYMKYLVPCYYILTTAEASSNLSRFDGVRYGHRTASPSDLKDMYRESRSEGFGPEVKKRIMLGTFVLSEGYFDAYFTKALRVRRLIQNEVNQILEGNDGFILPISASAPWRLDQKIEDPTQIYMSDIYTVLANLTGNPSVTVKIPTEKYNSRTSNSVQLIVNRGADMSIFNLAEKIYKKY
ncbi:MAG: Asp-tRNA(Asn)/Glu-tRNA(Gln) amidotransferase subunit GatA [Saprospiraceae bacterium]|nr:Asp-tRNA(Asn)/Glu-tRNA(Gln) amidotransferase subunit GatA [Saprospiraceae bacterium]